MCGSPTVPISLRLPSTKSISNAQSGSTREALGNLHGENENDLGSVGSLSRISEEKALPRTMPQPADTWQTELPAPPHWWYRPGILQSHTATAPDSASAFWTWPVWDKDPLLQALSGPAFRRRQNTFTAVIAVASVKTFQFIAKT